VKASACLRGAAGVEIEPKRVGLAVALAAHAAALPAFLLTTHQSSPKLVPISVEIIAQSEARDNDWLAPQPVLASKFTGSRDKAGPPPNRSLGNQPFMAAKLTAPAATGHSNGPGHLNDSLTDVPLAGGPNNLSNNPEIGVQSERLSLNLLSASATSPRKMDFVNQQHSEPPGPTITRRTDWQDNPVEDKQLKYSALGGTVRLTVREASSAGFVGTNFAPTFNLNKNETSQPFGSASTGLPANTMAKSKRVDWDVFSSTDFGVTVFGYQNDVGSGFKPFGENKKEFVTAGTSTMKTGGQVRLGALSIGFAHSQITNTVGSPANVFAPADFFAAQDVTANFLAAQNEVSVTLATPKLLSGMQGSVSNLLPTLWATFSDKKTKALNTGVSGSDTVSTSFGGTWNWNNAYATLGYWNYSSGQNPVLGATSSGRGLNANLGTYYSSFGIDVGLSYGRSEDTAVSWQSAGALYSSYVTVSYKPDKLPAITVTAAAGNYDYSSIASSIMPSDLYANFYAYASHSTYSSLTAGLDLAGWLGSNRTFAALTGPYSSVKLLYRYSQNAYYDNSAQPMKNPNSLVAMMIQGNF